MSENISILPIDNLVDFQKILEGNPDVYRASTEKSFLYYLKEPKEMFFIDKSKINLRHKVQSLIEPMCKFDLLHIMTITGKYIPIVDKDSNEVLITKEEYQKHRKKMSGIISYNAGDFIFSNNLYFKELDPYIQKVEESQRLISNQRRKILPKIQEALNGIIINGKKLRATIGFNSCGDIEIVETGSTLRGTSIPSATPDFDFTIRYQGDNNTLYEQIEIIKNALHEKLGGERLRHHVANDKLRIKGAPIEGLGLIDLDFSVNAQLEDYLSTDDALMQQLESIKYQDKEKYKLVVANIMFAKDYLKKSGAYKPARSLTSYERQNGYGGIGGIGIENMILQNGGSIKDALEEFLTYAVKTDEFIDFEKEYALMDFGKNHIAVSKKRYPYDNFVMKNMRLEGYRLMKQSLLDLKKEIVIEKYKKDNTK